MRYLLYLGLLLSLLSTGSCKKKPRAGLGGSTTLRVSTYHHSLRIDSARVSIRFNATDVPVDNLYDISADVHTDTNGNAYAIFEGLKQGEYYLYAEGWDPSIFNNVKGGIPYTIDQDGTIDLIIPVTEQH